MQSHSGISLPVPIAVPSFDLSVESSPEMTKEMI